jgi:hypothetical protein
MANMAVTLHQKKEDEAGACLADSGDAGAITNAC